MTTAKPSCTPPRSLVSRLSASALPAHRVSFRSSTYPATFRDALPLLSPGISSCLAPYSRTNPSFGLPCLPSFPWSFPFRKHLRRRLPVGKSTMGRTRFPVKRIRRKLLKLRHLARFGIGALAAGKPRRRDGLCLCLARVLGIASRGRHRGGGEGAAWRPETANGLRAAVWK